MREPRIARALIRLAAPASERDDVLADLREEGIARASRDGDTAARTWYRRQVRLSLAPLLRRRASLAASGLRAAWAHRGQTFGGLSKDMREAWRSMMRGRGYAALVVVTLALGIGVNTAIFTVVDALLFKALPYADGERLVRVAEWPRSGGNYTMSPAAFLDWRTRARTISAFEARLVSATGLLEAGEAERVNAAAVAQNRFHLPKEFGEPWRRLVAAGPGIVAEREGGEDPWDGGRRGHRTRDLQGRQIRTHQIKLWLVEGKSTTFREISGVDLQ